jgi:uncharacterized oxidoreductase
MNLTGNTIFITGGGSGIGRGLAEALHARGNQVIISGRRRTALEEVAKANPGIDFVELDITDMNSIASAAEWLISNYPQLNVLINNAGIMKLDGVDGIVDDSLIWSIVATNLMGPIRMTSAVIEHLKQQPVAYVIHVTSGVAFVPLSVTATYSATKAALHSLSLSQRYLLRNTSVKVLEMVPPYVQTELMDSEQVSDPRAMQLSAFIDETLQRLGTNASEVLTQKVFPLRNSAGPNDEEATNQVNDWFLDKNR